MGWGSVKRFVGKAGKAVTKYNPGSMILAKTPLGKYDPGKFVAKSFDEALNGASIPEQMRPEVLASLTKRNEQLVSLIKDSGELDDAQKKDQLAQLDTEFKSIYGSAYGDAGLRGGMGSTPADAEEKLTAYEASLTARIAGSKKENDVVRLAQTEQLKMMKSTATNSRLQSNQLNAFLGSVDAKQLAARMGVKT